MKTNCWLVLGTMLAANAMAQTNTPEITPSTTTPAPLPLVTNAPAAKPVKKKAVTHRKRKLAAAEETAAAEAPVTLAPGPAEIAASNVNVRGQASLKGEVVARLTEGDSVTVLEQINLQKHKVNEPAQWARIAFPTNANVWVSARYIDATNKTVLPKKLNLRAGPGENYSILGLIERGTPVGEISTKGDWMEIEAPTNAYAFVAAMYLKQEAPAAPAVTPVVTEPVALPAPETQPMAPAPATEPAAPPVESAPPPPRIVQHEGVVCGVTSLIAPTEYKLYDPATGNNIDFLHTTSTNLNLGRYVNMRVIVTGEEGLDERWKDTPVITIQRIQVISTNAVQFHISRSPRQSH
jgi:uncharacterized protein YgiM (DUF1202 family)